MRLRIFGVFICVSVCLTSATQISLAQTATFAARTAVSTISPCPSFCGGPGGISDFDSDGGVGFTTSSTSLLNIDGMGNAQAELLGPADLPILKAEAFSNAESPGVRSSRVAAQAFGLQGFYVPDPNYSLDITLTGIALDEPGSSNIDGSLQANVMIIRDNDPNTEIEFSTDYASMRFEFLGGFSDLELLADSVDGLGQSTLVLPADNTVQSVSTTLNAAGLNYGDLIYVWAQVTASGTRGGFADGFDTLTMQFNGLPTLSHDPLPPIPEPTTGLLLLSGLLVVGPRFRLLK